MHQDLNHDGLENSGDRITENFFDSFGRLTDVETDFDGDGTPDTYVNYKYNDLGQLERTATGSDPANNPTTATEYVYDRIGRLEEVKATHRDGSELTTPETTTYQYDAVGNLQQVLRHGGVGTVYTYDTLNRLTDLINFYDDNSDGLYDPDDPATANDNDDGDPLISSFRYTLRDDGKRTAAVEWFPGEGYENTTIGTALLTHRYVWEYDNAGRLISEELDRRDLGSGSFYDYTDTFSYDLVGNRTEYVRSGSSIFYDHYTKTYQYDANDRLVWEKDNLNSDSSIDNTTLYQYDNPAQAGDDNEGTRQTGKKKYNGDNEAGTGSPLSSTDYSYNLQGRLSEVDDGSDVTSYQYDYAGFRIETDVDGTVTRFLIDANNHSGHTQVLEEHDDSGNLERSYLLGHDVIAQHDTTNGLLYLIYDGHGSTRMLVGNTGITLRQSNDTPQIFAYTAYGEILDNDPVTLTAADDAQTVLLHTGEWFEHSTGWQYNRERWYDSSTGRWKRMDDFSGIKEDPQSLHKYLYTHADPVNGIDPTGLFSVVGIGVAGSIRNVLVGLDLSVLGGVNATVEGVQAGLSAQQIFVGLILDDILATVDLIVYTVAYALDVIESGINYVVGNEGQLRDSGGVAQASLGSFLFAKYSKLRNPSAIYQRNHLNTDAAWGNSRGGVIPHSQGVAVTLQGSKNQVGSEHFKFHLEMEKFFDKHRGGSKRPTTDQYNEALERALRKAGATLAQAKSLTKYAIAQQMAFGYSGRRPIPRLPDPDSFLKSFL